ncbi:hypothetical protein K439DRAFT_31301 [Ramaria rubella]|nr:hypothetical protein K439DRAFT_31301 [Ramaria rubella]
MPWQIRLKIKCAHHRMLCEQFHIEVLRSKLGPGKAVPTARSEIQMFRRIRDILTCFSASVMLLHLTAASTLCRVAVASPNTSEGSPSTDPP